MRPRFSQLDVGNRSLIDSIFCRNFSLEDAFSQLLPNPDDVLVAKFGARVLDSRNVHRRAEARFVGMDNIPTMGKPFQIVGAGIGFVAIFVIRFLSRLWRSMKGLTNKSMNLDADTGFVPAQVYICMPISMSVERGLENSSDSRAACGGDPAQSAQIRHFVESFQLFSGPPNFVLHLLGYSIGARI